MTDNLFFLVMRSAVDPKICEDGRGALKILGAELGFSHSLVLD